VAPALKMKAPVSWSRAVAAPFPCAGLSRSASLGAALRHVTAEARQRCPARAAQSAGSPPRSRPSLAGVGVRGGRRARPTGPSHGP
jgi:hypothetical protein